MKNILFTQMCCPVRASLCTHLGSAPMVNTWCGCSVQVVVLTMRRKSLCVTSGTCSRFVYCFFTHEMLFLWISCYPIYCRAVKQYSALLKDKWKSQFFICMEYFSVNLFSCTLKVNKNIKKISCVCFLWMLSVGLNLFSVRAVTWGETG
jgi:hypothetical protein